ncbi:hypothetical protein MBT84_14025 [Streptomyces sp. MBT84]|nr:hypothetical protein [Streptomyces sp. MBT84]
MRPLHRPLRPRKELVPGTEQRPLPLHHHPPHIRTRHPLTQRKPPQHPTHLRRQRTRQTRGRRTAGVPQGVHRGQEGLSSVLVLRDAGGCAFVEPCAFLQDQFGVETGRDLDLGVVPPGGDRIAPRLNGVGPPALARQGDGGAPAVGAGGQFAHRGPGAGPAFGVCEDDIGGDGVMALAEDRGGDLELLVHHRLGRTPALEDEGAYVEYGDSPDRGTGVRGRSGTRARGGCPRAGGTASACSFEGATVLLVEGAGEWCVGGMTAPVRVDVGGRMRVSEDGSSGATGGAFPPCAGGHSGTLLTTHAYVYLQDRPHPEQRKGPAPPSGGEAGKVTRVRLILLYACPFDCRSGIGHMQQPVG